MAEERPAVRRRAASHGVRTFAGGLVELPFVPELVRELTATFEALGFDPAPGGHRDLPSAELGRAVLGGLAAPADVAVVHVISHGHRGRSDGVYLLGADGAVSRENDVESWLKEIEDRADGPPTLFLLDLCHAGRLARLPWQSGGSGRSRVLAACQGDEAAYDGRFTRALINVLRDLRGLAVDPALEHVPLATVAQAVRREVNRLATEADGFGQQVTGSLVDISADSDLPFFPNPAYRAGLPRAELRRGLDPGVLPFLDDLDEGLDARHFIDRAAGTGVLGEFDPARLSARRFIHWMTGVGAPESEPDLIAGCFTGRDRQLQQLSRWINFFDRGTLAVLTGSPGAGKSALLGVLVCAAHPRLHAPTKPLWNRATHLPDPLHPGQLAAIHARRRTLDEVTASIARQLGLPPPGDPARLIAAMRDLPVPPVLVLDALDEAEDGTALMNHLLLPLAADRTERGATARLLVGTRRYPEYAPLLAAAAITDLDDIPTDVLEDDLNRYVLELLRATPLYRPRGAVQGAFAHESAQVLAREREWGGFLVAGLYTRHFVTTHTDPPLDDPAEAERLGAAVPRSLPEVFELDLDAQAGDRPLRPVLTALAFAQGQGMPVSVIARVAGALAGNSLPDPQAQDGQRLPPRSPGTGGNVVRAGSQARDGQRPRPGRPLSGAQVRDALDAGRFYLRRAVDTDGTVLYRLFHQGLADHLAERDDAGAVLPALLAALGPPGARDWSAAEPYLLRHALHHADAAGDPGALLDDPEFLLHADPACHADRPDSWPMLRAHRRAVADAGPAGDPRHHLALRAARAGDVRLAERVANPPGGRPLPWQPRHVWRRPAALPTAAPPTQGVPGHDGPVYALAVGSLDDRPIAVTGGADHTVRIHDLATLQQLGPPLHTARAPVYAVALRLHRGRPIAVTGEADGTVRALDLAARDQMGPAYTVHEGPAYGVACTKAADELFANALIALSVGADSLVRTTQFWNPGFLVPPTVVSPGFQVGHSGPVFGVAVHWIQDLPVAVTGGGDGTVRRWDLAAKEPLGEPLRTPAPVFAVTVAAPGGRPIIVAGGADGAVRLWDLATGAPAGLPLPGPRPVMSLAAGHLDGRPVIVAGGGDGTVRVWDLDTRREIARHAPGPASVPAVALAEVAGRSVVVGGDYGGRVTRSSPGPARPALLGPLGPSLALLAHSDGEVVARDTRSGEIRYSAELPAGRRVVECRTAPGAGRTVLLASDGTGWLWEPEQGPPVQTAAFDRAEPPVLVRGGEMVVQVVPGDGGTLRWRAPAGDLTADPGHRHQGAVTAVTAAAPGGRPLVFSGGEDATIRIWDPADRRQLDALPLPGPVRALAVTPDGHLLADTGTEVICFRGPGAPR
ncbi:hypothetical protein DPM19_11535 [Actinomadura craniellae]|uniref:Peptidase C14 caspase domain-containing protein n=1 Tax=Actinomadura craniellae TaxID=2231787 RepID=A0A365H8D2_9ACTN|nr:caspase family protein [Actinomadura craniellae]RAY15331.1 hypothetical protein DPM19_11535 [Actinomadura craniellae]